MPIDPNIALQVQQPKLTNPLADVTQILQLKQAQQLLPLRLQQAQQDIQESKLKLDAATTQAQEQLAIKQAITENGGDIEKALPKILQVAPTHGLAFATAARQAQQEQLKATGEKLKNAITSTELGARVLQGVPDAADPEAAYQQSIKVMQALGLDHGQMSPTYDPQQVQQYIQSGLSTKDQLAKKQTELKDKLEAMGRTKVTAQGIMQQNPVTGAFDIKVGEPEKAGAPSVHQAEDGSFHVINPNGESIPVTENGKPLTGRPPAEGKENDFEQFYKLWREDKKAPDSAAARLMARKAWTAATQIAPPGLSQDAINMLAQGYREGKPLPPMGRNAGAAISGVLNQAATTHPDVAQAAASYQANTASLKALQTTADRVDAFENTAGKNIDLFLNSAGKIIDTGSPLLNAPARMLSDKVFGSSNMAAFKAARETALTEAAKVLESPGGNQALTVSGRDAVKTLSDPNATLKQQIDSMKILKRDMANRKQSNQDQIKAITQRISQQSPEAAPQGIPGVGQQFNGQKVLKIEKIQ